MSFSKRASTYMNTTPEEEEDQVLINIHTLNNKIYFYDDINKYSALKLRIELETLVHKTDIFPLQTISTRCQFICILTARVERLPMPYLL